MRCDRSAVVAEDESDLGVAVRALEHRGLSFWDAMLWATAKRAGCPMLFSEDRQDGRRLGDALFVNPLDPAKRKLVDLALPELRNWGLAMRALRARRCAASGRALRPFLTG